MTEVTKAPLSTNAYLTSHHMQMWSAIPPWAPSLSLSSAGFDTNYLLYPILLSYQVSCILKEDQGHSKKLRKVWKLHVQYL